MFKNVLRKIRDPINDITTVSDRPAEFEQIAQLPFHQGRDLSYQERSRTRQKELYPDLKPYFSHKNPDLSFSQVCEIAQRQPDWTRVEKEEIKGSSRFTPLHVEFVAQTPWLKFKDDIVIEIRPGDQGSFVHMRSRSRLGRNDFGVNYKRIQRFFAELRAAGI